MANFDSPGAGLSRGLSAGFAIKNARNTQELAQKKQQQAEIEATLKRITDAATQAKEMAVTNVTAIASHAGDAAERGATPEQLAEMRKAALAAAMTYANFLEEAKGHARQSGLDPNIIPPPKEFVEQQMSIFDAQVQSSSLVGEDAAEKEQIAIELGKSLGDHPMAAFASELARQGNLVAATDVAKGILDPKLDIKTIQEGNENVTYLVDARSSDLIKEIARGTRTETVRTGPIIDEKSINTEALESANSSAALRRNLTGTLPEVEANKESVGARGAVGLGLGGFATTFLGEDAGDEITSMIAGNDQEQIAQVLTRLQTLRAQIIPIVTGEQSSRFSEPEREIANKALGVIDEIKGPADLTRSFPQVVGAMKELTVASLENEFEQATRSDAVEFPFDLNTRDGLIALGTELSNAGFSLEEAKRARDRLLRIQNK